MNKRHVVKAHEMLIAETTGEVPVVIDFIKIEN